MAAQIIEKEGVPEYAVVPYKEYLQLLALAEDTEDIRQAEAAKNSEDIPASVVNALLDGENPLRVWRKFRKLTQAELAKKAGITQAMITMIESGKRTGTVDVLGKLAATLDVDVDDLL